MEAKTPSTDPYKKTCKYSVCKKPFTARRLNMEYCSQECKKKSNNRNAGQFRAGVKHIIAQHALNWKILDTFYNQGKTEISDAVLRQNGFDYSKSTGLHKDIEHGMLTPEFYNYSLQKTKEDQFKIIKLW